jgi:hypothetical protein
MPLVRSYRTLAPLPVRRAEPTAIGGVFLWHCPHGHPHWALPSRPGRSGARTFLNRHRLDPEGHKRSDRDHLACFPHQPYADRREGGIGLAWPHRDGRMGWQCSPAEPRRGL